MRQLVVELRGARQAVFSCHEATSLTTKPLELADPTGWLLAWSLGGYMVARRNRTMTQYHYRSRRARHSRRSLADNAPNRRSRMLIPRNVARFHGISWRWRLG